MRRWLWLVVIVAVAVAASAATAATRRGGTGARPLIVTAAVTRRTLDSKVTLTGTLSRLDQRTVTAAAGALINDVSVKDGAVVHAGEPIIGVNGREAVAEAGAFPFFRPLDVGDNGQDVRQLDQILAADGYDPGPVSTLYTAQTQFALAQWQAAHGYPGAAPDKPQTVNVSLQPGAGYKVGAQGTVGMVIGPTAGLTSYAPSIPTAQLLSAVVVPDATTTTPAPTSTTTPVPTTTSTTAPPAPTLTIEALNPVTTKGTPAVFIVYASATSTAPVTFSVTEGGDAPPNEVLPPTGPFTIPPGASSVQVQVPTRQNGLVQPDATLTLGLDSGSGYQIGSPSVAATTIKSADVPKVSLVGGGAVSPGQASTIIVTADQAPVQPVQVVLSTGGTAQPTKDFVPLQPTVTLQPGQTTATVTLDTLASDTIQPDRFVVVSIAQSAAYAIGAVSSATITILGQQGDAALPLVTVEAGSHDVTKGQPFPLDIGLSQPMSTALTVTLTYGGTAIAGVDYSPPAGEITIPAGQTSLTVQIPTLADAVVGPDTILLVSIGPSPSYRIGSPSSATTVITATTIPVLTISAANGAVAEGGSTSFTITADQPPVKDTSVTFQVAGTAQPGKDYDPLTGTALLRAGQHSVSVVLRTINKNVAFEPTDMIVGAWPIRIGQVFVKAGDTVAPAAQLFTLTDTSFTVSLVASPSDRTQLKVGQNCTVQLQGGSAETTGVISQLDDNVTVDPTSKAQTYKGKISVGDLGAADGAAVSIDVVLQAATNVLSVPIAAVKQNGLGQDVVRVLDLAHAGRVSEVRVRTGLADSSYIEVDSGLSEGQVVIVETDRTSG